ncbi:hypothetical protein [Streptomyces sp. NPDC127098]|uniref:hypothetical protein n=1 Tax=Streptomyces sp. NPDC127098 TaxID=3347137 RepID=UPI00366293A8
MIQRPTNHAESPYDAAFLPRLRMGFRAPAGPVGEPVSKFGGQPVWLDEPTWPVHPRTREPLVFIGQFRVPGEELRLAYLFLHEDDGLMESEPETGEAVVLTQPGGRVPPFAAIGPPGTRGRTLWRYGSDDAEIPVEWLIDLRPVSAEVDAGMDGRAAWGRYMAKRGPAAELPDHPPYPPDFLGGAAIFPNFHAWGLEDGPWRFLCQFQDRGDDPDSDDPFFLNFGYGSGFVFLSPDHREGRFIHDCT